MLLTLSQPCWCKLHARKPVTSQRACPVLQRGIVQIQGRCLNSKHRPSSKRHAICSTVADPDEGGGTSTIERPDLLREGSNIINLTEAGFGGTETTKGKSTGGGNWRVLLIDDPKHTEQSVVTAITTVLPGTDANHAKNCFATSRKLGQAIITSCLKEHAEFYAEQLFKHGARTKIEPDSSTL